MALSMRIITAARSRGALGTGPSARPRLVLGLIAAMSLVATGAAWPQTYIQPPCSAAATPVFEDHLQSVWYRRFWTGDCAGLPILSCRAGSPYWNEVVHTLVARAPQAQRQAVAVRACRLGRRIGLEWTRPKSERRIGTPDLEAFNTTLQRSPDVASGLTAVEAKVRAKIGG